MLCLAALRYWLLLAQLAAPQGMSTRCQGSFGGGFWSQVAHGAGGLVTCVSSLIVTWIVLTSLEVMRNCTRK